VDTTGDFSTSGPMKEGAKINHERKQEEEAGRVKKQHLSETGGEKETAGDACRI